MTRFGRWFAGAVTLVLALFVLGLLVPRGDRAIPDVTMPTVLSGGSGEVARFAASGLRIPVIGVEPAELVDSFGDPRGVDGARGHGALDIAAPRGTTVVAAADGTVEKLFESERGGHTVYIRSPNRRNVYYYAHLDSYAPVLREGAGVHAGEPIGTVGSTGDADPAGPHLHFEIKRVEPAEAWHQGRPLNPYPLLAAGPGGG